mmetsp:Transcript_12513/g.35460  ORF Transcript_12513/g.35460 Transcript_12513/m.35460 type:complete len:318 (-) Transcript_12513:7-960(-)
MAAAVAATLDDGYGGAQKRRPRLRPRRPRRAAPALRPGRGRGSHGAHAYVAHGRVTGAFSHVSSTSACFSPPDDLSRYSAPLWCHSVMYAPIFSKPRGSRNCSTPRGLIMTSEPTAAALSTILRMSSDASAPRRSAGGFATKSLTSQTDPTARRTSATAAMSPAPSPVARAKAWSPMPSRMSVLSRSKAALSPASASPAQASRRPAAPASLKGTCAGVENTNPPGAGAGPGWPPSPSAAEVIVAAGAPACLRRGRACWSAPGGSAVAGRTRTWGLPMRPPGTRKAPMERRPVASSACPHGALMARRAGGGRPVRFTT